METTFWPFVLKKFDPRWKRHWMKPLAFGNIFNWTKNQLEPNGRNGMKAILYNAEENFIEILHLSHNLTGFCSDRNVIAIWI